MTFSIVARDGDSEEWGVAVASKFLAVGAVVGWARAGVGSIATQALANVAYGPDGLELLRAGSSAVDAIAALTGPDADREHRQLGIVDSTGAAATFTGEECMHWAGGVIGDGFACQGNILTGPDVVDAMAEAFASTTGSLASRLLSALTAGDNAGGDSRGRQSAALLVARDGGGYGGGTDISVDLRVDDHPNPVSELARLLDIHGVIFPRPEDLDFVNVDDALAGRLQIALAAAGHTVESDLRQALYAFVGKENLEERWSDDSSVIERGILRHLGI